MAGHVQCDSACLEAEPSAGGAQHNSSELYL